MQGAGRKARRRRCMRPVRAAWTAALVASATPGLAQAPATAASPFLPPDHWAAGAVRRLEAAGLAGTELGWDGRVLPLDAAIRLFRHAAGHDAHALAPLARGYLARVSEELALPADAAGAGPAFAAAAVTVGYEHGAGRVRAGIGYDNATDWTGPVAEPDLGSGAMGLALSAALPPHLALRVETAWSEDRVALREGHVAAAWRGIGGWLGRRAVGYGPGQGGGIVLGGTQPLDGGGLFLTEPLVLPGPLHRLGTVRFETFLSRIENGDRIREPWLWGMRAALRPHPRVTAGVTRAVMFGGEGNSGLSVRNLAYMMIGKHAGRQGEFDNQVVAVDLRYLPPLGDLPLALYLEWGLDDSAGAWKDVPATVVGLETAALPGLPAMALGVERTTFAASCCGNTIWYRNWAFRAGWSDDGRPLGHPLGGHGTEWLAHLRADLHDARLRFEARAFARVRGEENLYAPDRQGKSAGGELCLEGRIAPRVDLVVRGGLEEGGRAWREANAYAGLRVRLR